MQPQIQPLAGIMILDLSRVLAGPLATQNLADLGADVVKIEKPGEGDETRRWGPPFAHDANGADGDATYFFCCNRGKRSVTVDFTRPEGAEVIRRLAARADVLVENHKVGSLERYGLDSAALRSLNPRLVYCSITGFGQSGPYADRPGYDALIQAMGGLMSVTGEPDGNPGGGPQKVGVAVVDLMAGSCATSAILAALLARVTTGQGAHIDISLLDVQVAALANQATAWLIGRCLPQRLGNSHPSIVPYQPFTCADGEVMLAIGNDGQFAALCRAADRPELASDPRFRTNAGRVVHREALLTLLSPLLAGRACAEWVLLGKRHGFPCGPINTIDRVFDDPQVNARELIRELESRRYGAVRTVANPMRFDGRPAVSQLPPPELGSSTVEVLCEHGFSSETIRDLQARGVI
ncbi:MAG TPA: CaiB/BaiF CoA-transferase family protein [Steroidobacteraceae bacterium]|nr:CaiB/BaiF CoA-transferase family protein [Steroidobacteraceae bacterium]